MEQLEQDLASHAIIGVDTSPFIYLWERHPRFFPLSETLFRYLKQPEVKGITSVITLIETCVHPQRQGRPDLVAAYERALLSSQGDPGHFARRLCCLALISLAFHIDCFCPLLPCLLT